MNSLTYRPEIDGLRALAVLSVLACHAGISWLSGGYIGVDVFFVISGYLITSLILKDMEAGSFSFLDFWERRIRRILPPLFLVMFATTLVCWFLFLPADFQTLGQQVAAQSVFSSNILFKSQAGYFDTESITKPLLHTWSLAVEEQFYLFLPIALFFLWKLRPPIRARYLIGFALVAFIWSCFIVHTSPSSAFYLLPFRSWELLCGSFIALYGRNVNLSPKLNELLSTAGLIAIVSVAVLYTDKTTFPGLTALPAVLGAVAFILANQHGLTKSGQIMASPIPVFIGLISYSLYLWHWPIISILRYTEIVPLNAIVVSTAILTAFALAVLTWKFVETPIRRKAVLSSRKSAYVFAALGITVMGTSGLLINYTHGVPQRLPIEVVRFADGALDFNQHRDKCNKPAPERFEQDTICKTGEHSQGADYILWGDSFADAIAPMFYDPNITKSYSGYLVTAHGCPPILEFRQKNYDGFDCPGFNDLVLKLIQDKDIKTIILAGNWTYWINDDYADFRDASKFSSYSEIYPDKAMAAISRTVDILTSQGRKVYFLYDVPYVPFEPPRTLALKTLYALPDIPHTFSDYNYNQVREKELIPLTRNWAENSNITIIDPYDQLCHDGQCMVSHEGRSLYFNKGHLSTKGAMYLAPLFSPIFKN